MTSKKVKMQLIKLNFQQKYGIITKGCNMKKNITSYKEYISSLTKDELINIVTLYNLNCSGKTKEDYIKPLSFMQDIFSLFFFQIMAAYL